METVEHSNGVNVDTSLPLPQLLESTCSKFETVKEGLAYILTPRNTATSLDPNRVTNGTQENQQIQSVFYNPIQQFNRDLSVLAIKAYSEDLIALRNLKTKSGRRRKAENRQTRATRALDDSQHLERNRTTAEAAEALTQLGYANGSKRKANEAISEQSEDYRSAKITRVQDAQEEAVQRGEVLSDEVTNQQGPNQNMDPMLEHTAAKRGDQPVIQDTAGQAEISRREGVISQGPGQRAGDQGTALPHAQATPLEAGQIATHEVHDEGSVCSPAIIFDGTLGQQPPYQHAAPVYGGEISDHPLPARDYPQKTNFHILDALSATGLRALRYAKEIPAVTSVVAIDMSRDATRCIEMNVSHNQLEDRISIITGNAVAHMYNFASLGARNTLPDKASNQVTPTSGKYDVIDLDPYGTAVPFLDAALQALNDGGLLCVTCTDAGVWASCGYSEKAYALYGGTPIKGQHSHEGGLRLIIHAISTTAARYGMAIEPLLSLSIDFYARVFVRIRRSAADVKYLCGKTMLVYSCDHGCGAWTTQFMGRNDKTKGKTGTTITKHGLAQAPTAATHCEHCGFKTHLSGPMYGGPLHNPAFIEAILDQLPHLNRETYQTVDRIEGMLSTALEEICLEGNVDNPPAVNETTQPERPIPLMNPAENDRYHFFFLPSVLARTLRCEAPREAAIKGALRHAGYRVTRSHTKAGSVRTDAPWSFIWHMMREWVRQKAPVKEGAIKPGTAGFGIMERARMSAQTAAVRSVEGNKSKSMGNEHCISNDEPSTEQKTVVFDEALARDSEKKKRLVRYPENPRANWGPMIRARKG